MKNIAVFVSVGGTNLQVIIDGLSSGRIQNGQISLVLSSKSKNFAVERARSRNIPVEIVKRRDYPDEGEFSRKILDAVRHYEIDLIVLAGFLSVLSSEFIKLYENK